MAGNIAARGFDPKSSRGGLGPLSHAVFLGTAGVSVKWHLIPSNGFSRVHECDRRHTDIQMDTTVPSVAIGGITFSDAA